MFLLIVIFKKDLVPIQIGQFWNFIGLIVYLNFSNYFYSLPYFLKAFLSCFTPTNVFIGFDLMKRSEKRLVGVLFENLFTRDPEVQLSFGEVLIFMAIGLFVQLLAIFYVEKVFPGKFGSPEPWYFPVKRFLKKSEKNFEEYEMSSNNENFEDEQRNLKVGIRVEKLTKKFQSVPVVKNFSLNVFEDQITVLLGKLLNLI